MASSQAHDERIVSDLKPSFPHLPYEVRKTVWDLAVPESIPITVDRYHATAMFLPSRESLVDIKDIIALSNTCNQFREDVIKQVEEGTTLLLDMSHRIYDNDDWTSLAPVTS